MQTSLIPLSDLSKHGWMEAPLVISTGTSILSDLKQCSNMIHLAFDLKAANAQRDR